MGTEFIVNGASGFNPGVDSTLQLTDTDHVVYKIKAKEDAGLEILRNGVRVAPLEAVEAKTASYTLTLADHGKIFTTEGASGAVTFTLPATANLPLGWSATFFNAAGQNMIVAAGTADTMVVFNDAAADSIAFQTASELIGNAVKIVKLTTTLIGAFVYLGAETATPTIAT